MPKWTNAPPTDPRGQGLPLLRTPANGALRAIVTSDRLVGTDTHFYGGHTIPCDRPTCDACDNGVAYRWHGYLTAYNPNDQLHFIFEMTAQAADAFNTFFNENGTLRTAAFEAYRWQHRRNGRVIVKVEPSAVREHTLPPAPDVVKCMAIIWRLPPDDVFVAGVDRGHAKIWAEDKGNGQSSDPKDYPQPGYEITEAT